jgi:hypothetical protein
MFMLGGEAIRDQFRDEIWKAYRGQERMSLAEVDRLVSVNSIDVTLHPRILLPGNKHTLARGELAAADPYDPKSIEWVEANIPPEGLYLRQGCQFLGAVRERFECSNPVRVTLDMGAWTDPVSTNVLYAPMFEGRSTVGRMFVTTHETAGFADYGFSGAITLEVSVNFPGGVKLYPGMRIGQIYFVSVYRPRTYKGAYSGPNHNDGPVPPVLGRERF